MSKKILSPEANDSSNLIDCFFIDFKWTRMLLFYNLISEEDNSLGRLLICNAFFVS